MLNEFNEGEEEVQGVLSKHFIFRHGIRTKIPLSPETLPPSFALSCSAQWELRSLNIINFHILTPFTPLSALWIRWWWWWWWQGDSHPLSLSATPQNIQECYLNFLRFSWERKSENAEEKWKKCFQFWYSTMKEMMMMMLLMLADDERSSSEE